MDEKKIKQDIEETNKKYNRLVYTKCNCPRNIMSVCSYLSA